MNRVSGVSFRRTEEPSILAPGRGSLITFACRENRPLTIPSRRVPAQGVFQIYLRMFSLRETDPFLNSLSLSARGVK